MGNTRKSLFEIFLRARFRIAAGHYRIDYAVADEVIRAYRMGSIPDGQFFRNGGQLTPHIGVVDAVGVRQHFPDVRRVLRLHLPDVRRGGF
jgi:hypothetical protein